METSGGASSTSACSAAIDISTDRADKRSAARTAAAYEMNISVITPISTPTLSPSPVAPNGPASHWGTGRTDSGSSESVPAAEIDTTSPVPSSPDRPSSPKRVREEPERACQA